ncbi:MAG: tetratricopeptide repeat protein, partial [Anaerolineae bacterium]|nr:tetratricopeptide repeat protein [Anaerolineae bacterium]
MSEEFKIQCQSCGTVYNDLEEVCPYCGTPQPDLQEEISVEDPFVEDEPFIEEALDDEEPEDELFDDTGLADPRLDDPEPDFDDESYPPEADYQDEQLISEDEAATTTGREVLADDDIFAVAGDEPFTADDVEPDYLGEMALAPDFDDFAGDEDALLEDEVDDEDEIEDNEKPRYFRRMRLLTGCLGTLVCVTLLYGSIGIFAAFQGLQERAVEIEAEAEVHYERGQTHLSAGAIELAIAEFERALNLNPNLLAARQALREAQNISQSQPTPTSETRSAAAVTLLKQAENEIDAKAWGIAAETLSQVRDLDPDYEPDRVSDLIFDVNYQLGLDYLAAENVAQAALALEAALSENPDDRAANETLTNISLYQVGLTALNDDLSQEAVEALSELYENDPNFFDVEAQLATAYQAYGDELALTQKWCEAEAQYTEASLLASRDTSLKTKVAQSGEQCEGTFTASPESSPTRSASTATSAQRTPTPVVTAAGGSAADDTSAGDSPGGGASAGGRIYYSAFNPNESRWEILAVPASGGAQNVIVTEATMPDVSPNGQLLLYRSEAQESEGFHLFNLTTGEDNRITIFRQDVLPRWGGNNAEYL